MYRIGVVMTSHVMPPGYIDPSDVSPYMPMPATSVAPAPPAPVGTRSSVGIFAVAAVAVVGLLAFARARRG